MSDDGIQIEAKRELEVEIPAGVSVWTHDRFHPKRRLVVTVKAVADTEAEARAAITEAVQQIAHHLASPFSAALDGDSDT